MVLIGMDGPSALLGARTCAVLEKYADLTALRVRVRGVDQQLSRDLEDVRTAAMAWRSSATGTADDSKPELDAGSEWFGTGAAAEVLGVGDRAIRKAIAENRLPATEIGGRYRISREDIEHYKAARAARRKE